MKHHVFALILGLCLILSLPQSLLAQATPDASLAISNVTAVGPALAFLEPAKDEVKILSMSPLYENKYRQTAMAVVVANGTKDEIDNVTINGVVRDSSDVLVATIERNYFLPDSLPSSGIAIGEITFSRPVEQVDRFELSLLWDLSANLAEPRGKLTLTDLTRTDDDILGIATNDSQAIVIGPWARVACFDNNNTLTGQVDVALQNGAYDMEVGDVQPFTVSTAPFDCTSWIVVAG